MKKKDRPIVNVILFILTFISTTFIGGLGYDSFHSALINGLFYSATLMVILLCHEFGHYFAAKKFGVDSTLPYFIPVPIPPVGTMGAIIKTRSLVPSRRALLYIGTMGPLPGFILSLVAVIVGIFYSEIKPLPTGSGDLMIYGDSLLITIIVKIIHGTIPSGSDIFFSPFAMAGWFGFLITSLNLMPIGQLDGGHIVYALIGRKQRWFGWGALFCLLVLSFIWWGWIIWIVLTLLILMVAHHEVPEGETLSVAEKIIGWVCIIILILTFVPVPLKIL
ncbi:MAG: site-2 protease family protein [Spirochaetes bacterium]|nr:site-2 protease family protein [Spirochaetota bacterium]